MWKPLDLTAPSCFLDTSSAPHIEIDTPIVIYTHTHTTYTLSAGNIHTGPRDADSPQLPKAGCFHHRVSAKSLHCARLPHAPNVYLNRFYKIYRPRVVLLQIPNHDVSMYDKPREKREGRTRDNTYIEYNPTLTRTTESVPVI